MIKSRRKRTGNGGCIGKMRNMYKSLIGKPEGKRLL
jgi:hypothetical protein